MPGHPGYTKDGRIIVEFIDPPDPKPLNAKDFKTLPPKEKDQSENE